MKLPKIILVNPGTKPLKELKRHGNQGGQNSQISFVIKFIPMDEKWSRLVPMD